METLYKIIKWTLPITLGVSIICFAVLGSLYFRGLYYFDINYLSISESTNISKEVIEDNYNTLIDYLTDEEVTTLELPSFVMSDNGKVHFEDVKNIFMMIKRALYVCGIYSMIGIIINISRRSYKFLKHTVILTFAIPTIILAISMLDFDKSFVIFHELAFSNDYWVFDPAKDPVIMILPQDFFMHSFIFIIVLVIGMALLLIGLYHIIKKVARQ